jgi:hypothetical protein
MKRQVNLERAAKAETFGALAVASSRARRGARPDRPPLTASQHRALLELVRSLLQIAREAGAGGKQVVLDGVSFELSRDDAGEILSIRTAATP